MAKKLIYAKLKKVADDPRFSGQELDVNGRLCSVTGLPPVTVDNLTSNPNYYPPINDAAQCNGDPNPYVLFTETPLRQNTTVDICDLVPYEYFPLYVRNGGFYVNLGDTIYFKKGETYYEYISSNLEPEYSFTTYLNYNEGDMRRYTLTIDPSNGTVLAKNACTPIFYNTEETREFVKNDCGAGQEGDVYYVTIPDREVSASTEEEVDELVNSWFDANGQSIANTYGTCLTDLRPANVWEVTGSPCTGARTLKTIYFDGANNKFYTNSSKTTLYNGTFFPENNILSNYIVVINGEVQDSTNNVCPISGGIYYNDLPEPTAISVYGNDLIACYADKQIVVKYSTAVSTNPIGVIVAGELNRICINTNSPDHWLNAPCLVEWRDDGERFVVYSSGGFKSLKIFTKNGLYLNEGAITGYDGNNQWDYVIPSIPTDPITTPASTSSLVGMLGSDNENLIWLLVGMTYSTKLSDENYDTIFLNLWRKQSNSQNHFKLYAVTPMNASYGQGLSLTANVATQTGYAFNQNPASPFSGDDVIRGIAVTKKTLINSRSTRYKVGVVVPRAKGRSGYNKYRYYDFYEVEVNINSIFNVVDYQPQIEPVAFNDKGDYRTIPDSIRGVSMNNVAASCVSTGRTLGVVIRSSTSSFWNVILKGINDIKTSGTIVGLSFAVGSIVDLFIKYSCFVGTVGQAILAAAVLVSIILLLLRTVVIARKVRSGYLTFTFSDMATTSIYSTGGAIEMEQWIDNNTGAFGRICLNKKNEGNLSLYSLKGGKVYYDSIRKDSSYPILG